jgi:hypothetical protein
MSESWYEVAVNVACDFSKYKQHVTQKRKAIKVHCLEKEPAFLSQERSPT